jgi:exosortase
MIMKIWIPFLLWAAIFFPLYPSLLTIWLDDSNNSHGLLVPLIFAFFIWRLLPALKMIPMKSNARGLLILLVSMGLYVLSYAGSVSIVARSMIVLSLVGLVLYNFGSAIFRKLAFPLLFLLFMVPLPTSVIGLISLPLQRLATYVSAMLIGMISIPVYQEGNMLYFVQTQLEVAEACSGIHSIMALLMLGAVFVYMNPMTNLAKIILLASTIPVALIANIVRVTGTGILAHFHGAAVARGFLHDLSGMAVFLFGLGLLMIIFKLLQSVRSSNHC